MKDQLSGTPGTKEMLQICCRGAERTDYQCDTWQEHPWWQKHFGHELPSNDQCYSSDCAANQNPIERGQTSLLAFYSRGKVSSFSQHWVSVVHLILVTGFLLEQTQITQWEKNPSTSRDATAPLAEQGGRCQRCSLQMEHRKGPCAS